MKAKYQYALEDLYRGDYPGYIVDAGKTYLKITVGGSVVKRITPKDVVLYYATEARNIVSGCRTLAGIVGDWRPIDGLAKESLEWFKQVNRDALVTEGRKYGMTLRG